MRLLVLGETVESPAVYQEEIHPSVVVIVIEGETTSGCFKQILVLEFTPIDRLATNPASGATSTKLTPSGVPSSGDLGPGGGGAGLAS